MKKKPSYEELEQQIRNLKKRIDASGNIESSPETSESLYRIILENISDAVIVSDDQGRMVYVCPNTTGIFGLSPDQILSLNTIEKLMNGVICDIADLSNKGEFQNLEWTIVDAVGQTRFLLVNVKSINIKDGSVLYVMRDITDRKKAQADLYHSEKKYQAMMESFVEPLYIGSCDYIVEYMNPAMIHRIGRDATGEKCYYALHGLDSKCDWCILDKIFQGDKFEVNIRSPLDDRQYRVSSMPIKHIDGNKSKMTVFKDITDYLVAVSDKEKAQVQLMQSQKMESIGTLAGGIAHDFNNILSSIIGFSELALDEAEKGTILEDDLQEVLAAGMRAKDLVKQILSFARQSDEAVKPVQVKIIAKEVLKFIKSSIQTTIQINGNLNSDSFIMGSPTQIHQVFMNLFTNAAYAMDENGGILDVSMNDITIKGMDISDLPSGEYIEIKVADTGMGIPSQNIHSIFEPYFTTKPVDEGTGMGLSVVHGLVENYGGKIMVDSTVGKGSCFTIYLPITEKQNAQTHSEKKDLPLGNEKILFVDDEAAIVKVGSKSLEQLGYSVTPITSSVEALELFKLRPQAFDMVVTDMTMPNMTGDKLACELMKIRPDIPVVLCTGYSKKISEKRADEIGISAFVYKPVVKADLAVTVRKILDDANSSE